MSPLLHQRPSSARGVCVHTGLAVGRGSRHGAAAVPVPRPRNDGSPGIRYANPRYYRPPSPPRVGRRGRERGPAPAAALRGALLMLLALAPCATFSLRATGEEWPSRTPSPARPRVTRRDYSATSTRPTIRTSTTPTMARRAATCTRRLRATQSAARARRRRQRRRGTGWREHGRAAASAAAGSWESVGFLSALLVLVFVLFCAWCCATVVTACRTTRTPVALDDNVVLLTVGEVLRAGATRSFTNSRNTIRSRRRCSWPTIPPVPPVGRRCSRSSSRSRWCPSRRTSDAGDY